MMTIRSSTVCLLVVAWCTAPGAARAGALPFRHDVEVFRSETGDLCAFTIRLEQPFLAEEFEKSAFLRLQSPDERAYLIYPKETAFRQKHAEFYGRLRGEGTVTLKLSYQTVSENLDGSRHTEVHRGDVAVTIPAAPGGPERILRQWADQQNQYFAHLLRYYPEETFFQYCLLQSQARYGVTPPAIPKQMPDRSDLETGIYQMVTSSHAIQESLQRDTLRAGSRSGDLTIHISSLRPPELRSLPYEKLLEERGAAAVRVHEMSALIPEDYYFLQFNSMRALNDIMDLSTQWGTSLLRLFTVRAQDNQLQSKLEEQLCLRRDALTRLFADAVIDRIGITGADAFVLEGADVTLILRLKRPGVFQQAAGRWLETARRKHPDLVTQEFNYRGHKIAARYTGDRVVSSFAVTHEPYVVYSNSHRSIRRVVDAATGTLPSLHGAADYRYVTTILPPRPDESSGYLFASEAFIKHQVTPAAKISEKRRLECFNNLVMLNNASLFYRLEHGKTPASLSELVDGKFVALEKIVCPHGGAYALDVDRDTCTCSLHNRLKYLTPNIELSVLKVSNQEQAEYERYKQRYQAFWGQVFDPLAVRITAGQRVRLETCVLPMANGSQYNDLRDMVAAQPRELSTARIAPAAVGSFLSVAGRDRIGQVLRSMPGVEAALRADPTLTDLSWLGDRFSLHLCDGDAIVDMDLTRLRTVEFPMIGRVDPWQQALVGTVLAATMMPVYVTVEVENREKADRLLELLAQQAFLTRGNIASLPAAMDAYRLPDYKGHAMYVVSGRIYALKLRLHVALVGDHLVAATKPQIVRDVIDAQAAKDDRPAVQAHMLLRLNRRALNRLYDDAQLYWAEKTRLACHRNISSVYSLCKLYGVSCADVPQLSEAKYGVHYFCPDGGAYTYDPQRDAVVCSVHGNREDSRQNLRLDRGSSFARFFASVDEIIASLRFCDDALIATVEIVRSRAEDR